MLSSVFSQTSINNYKYVIVPNQFHFLSSQDKYQLNSLTAFLFEKYGFSVLMAGSEYPTDLKANRCLALQADVIKDSGIFKTELIIELQDCHDKVVFTSAPGESRKKEFKVAYNLALRDAFTDVKALNYSYEPSTDITSIQTSPSQNNVPAQEAKEIEDLKKQIQDLKKEKATEVTEVPTPESAKPNPAAHKDSEALAVIEGASNVLYAQETANGYQLVDSAPKVVYRLKRTHVKDTFLVEGHSALVYKKANDWVIEYYSGDTLQQEVLNIKF